MKQFVSDVVEHLFLVGDIMLYLHLRDVSARKVNIISDASGGYLSIINHQYDLRICACVCACVCVCVCNRYGNDA